MRALLRDAGAPRGLGLPLVLRALPRDAGACVWAVRWRIEDCIVVYMQDCLAYYVLDYMVDCAADYTLG